MKKPWLAIAVLIVLALACGSSAPKLKTADDFMQEYGGKVEVYNRILISTDCTGLQSEFDQAEANLKLQEPGTAQYKWGLGYMDAADQRLKEIGCYGNTKSIPPTVDILSIIKQTADAALIQTQLASSPTANVTSTFLPTLTQPATLIPSLTSAPSATVVFIFATEPAPAEGGSVCPCSGDSLNCKDFSSQSSAQACMNYCIAQGAGDIHNLDGNANGQACESL